MRLVKKTVNQDDVSSYHLFYADGKATPGTDITFFDWPAPRERGGRIALPAPGSASPASSLTTGRGRFTSWASRTARSSSATAGRRWTSKIPKASGSASSSTTARARRNPWEKSPVPAEHQIRGLGPITISVPDLADGPVLTRVMDMRPRARVRRQSHRRSDGATVHVYEMGDGGPSAELHVAVEPELPPARPGAGGVHHVAFRVPTFEEYDPWTTPPQLGVPSSGPVDRFYFRASTSASPTASCSSSRPTARASTRTSRSKRWRAALAAAVPGAGRKEIEAGLKPL